MLANDVAIIFVVVYVVEAALIIFGNAFTIFVFSTSTRTSHIKRTCYLLINLAVADLFVGITEPIILGTSKFHKMTATRSKLTPLKARRQTDLPGAMQLFALSVSVFFLALISLERAFAVLKPLRHRVASTRVYIYSIVVVWAVGIFIFGLLALIYHIDQKMETKTLHFAVHFCLFISILVICASYLKIRARLSSSPPEVAVVNSRQTKHNVRLSRTLFVVIALSLLFLLPAVALYTGMYICHCSFHPYMMWTVNALLLANSLVNPFVYSFRMPVFKEALEKLSRKRTRHIEATSLALSLFPTPRINHTSFSAAATCGGSQLKPCTESGDQHITASSPKLTPAVSTACNGARQASTPSTSIVTRL